VVDTASNINE